MSILLWVLFGLTWNSTGTLFISSALLLLLPYATTVTVTTTADASAVFVCLNRGGHVPPGQPQAHVTTHLSKSTTIALEPGVEVVTTTALDPPQLPEDFGCPQGQQPALSSVVFDNIEQFNSLDSTVLSIPAPFAVPLKAPVPVP